MIRDGRHEADLERVTIAASAGRHVLVLECATDDADRVTARQPLASLTSDDPLAMTATQLDAFRSFAARLGIGASEPREIADAVRAMAGRRVVVKVRHRNGRIECQVAAPGSRGAARAHQTLLAGMDMEAEGAIMQARACFELRECDAWGDLGHDSLAGYLARPGLTMRRSTFYMRAQVWEDWVVVGGVDPARLAGIGWGRLRVLSRAVREGLVDVDAALMDAASLPTADLDARYRHMYRTADESVDVDRPGDRSGRLATMTP